MTQSKISLPTAVLMIINIMVGTGILIGPGRMAAVAGDASFLGWPIVALLFLPLILCTVQLSAMLPGAGGFYLYAKEGLGQRAGFFGGWQYIVGYTFAAAVELLALRGVLLTFFGDYWFIANNIVFAIILLTICIVLNLLTLKLFSRILNTLTISKLIPLIVLIAIIPFIMSPQFAISGQEIALLPYSLPFAIFGYFGFEYCCNMSHLIVNSERNGPLAIIIGFLVTALLYMLFHFGALNLMGAHNLATLGAPAYAQFINIPFLAFLKPIIAILIPAASIITLFAGTVGMINVNALLLQAMADEQLFTVSPLLNKLSKWGRPWSAIIIEALVVLLIVVLVPSLDIVGSLCNTGILLAFVLPFLSLLLLQKSVGAYKKMMLTIIALIITLGLTVYSFYSIWLLGQSMIEFLLHTLPMIVAVGAGFVLYKDKR